MQTATSVAVEKASVWCLESEPGLPGCCLVKSSLISSNLSCHFTVVFVCAHTEHGQTQYHEHS